MNVEITRGRSDIYDILTHIWRLFSLNHTKLEIEFYWMILVKFLAIGSKSKRFQRRKPTL
jgi:hypothetical protein